MLLTDLQAIYQRDPAARHWLEVITCYPGLHALWFYRVAHWLYLLGLPVIPRLISQLARFLTGVEIHPGATIGQGVVIDHGSGIVIGETAIVGNNCLLYQDVTLGGTGKETGKRHPTLGENVFVGAGAKVLGNILIGNLARIGAGSVVLRDVPSDCTVVGIPGRIVREKKTKESLNTDALPDVEAQVIRVLFDRIQQLEHTISRMQLAQGIPRQESQKPVTSVATPSLNPRNNHAVSDHAVSNQLIEEFLDGAGI